MNLVEFVKLLCKNLGSGHDHLAMTVHTGGNNWEDIVDIAFCMECKQYHIISEKRESNESI